MPEEFGGVDHLLFDRNKWDALIAAETRKHLEGFINGGAAIAVSRAEEIGINGVFDVGNPEVQTWLSEYSFKFARKINDTAADQLRGILSEGLNAGETILELRQRILDDAVIGPQATKYRAEMIASTESSRASDAGREKVWELTNARATSEGRQAVFVGKVWRANPDACDFCVAMDGASVEIGGTFLTVGDVVPLEDGRMLEVTYEDADTATLHPWCRCWIDTEINEAAFD